jgi:hypothetical protein
VDASTRSTRLAGPPLVADTFTQASNAVVKNCDLGQRSIGINEQYRICFVWTERGPWMSLQMRWDLYHALRSKAARDVERVKPVAAA